MDPELCPLRFHFPDHSTIILNVPVTASVRDIKAAAVQRARRFQKKDELKKLLTPADEDAKKVLLAPEEYVLQVANMETYVGSEQEHIAWVDVPFMPLPGEDIDVNLVRGPRPSMNRALENPSASSLTSYQKAGYVKKQGSEYKSWKKRYVVLKDGYLYYFGGMKDASPKGSFFVGGYTCELASGEAYPKLCIHLVHPDNKRMRANEGKAAQSSRDYYLAVEEQGDFEQWMEAFRSAGYRHRCAWLEWLAGGLECDGGLDTEGLFRVAGPASQLQELRTEFVNGNIERAKPHPAVAASMMKHILGDAEPLTTFRLYSQFVQTGSIPDAGERTRQLASLAAQLPLRNRTLLRFLCGFCLRVAAHSVANKMTIDNLAIVFGPNLVRPDPAIGNTDILADASRVEKVTSAMIKDYSQIMLGGRPVVTPPVPFELDALPGVPTSVSSLSSLQRVSSLGQCASPSTSVGAEPLAHGHVRRGSDGATQALSSSRGTLPTMTPGADTLPGTVMSGGKSATAGDTQGTVESDSLKDDCVATNSEAEFVRAKFPYFHNQRYLMLTRGAVIRVLQKRSDGWMSGELGGLKGYFPAEYVEEVGAEEAIGFLNSIQHWKDRCRCLEEEVLKLRQEKAALSAHTQRLEEDLRHKAASVSDPLRRSELEGSTQMPT